MKVGTRCCAVIVVLLGSTRSAAGAPEKLRRGAETQSSTAAEAKPSDVEAPTGTPYSITISGGLSLGSYEAGMNWIFIEWLRRQREASHAHLAGVTGASAGAINALFSAIRYCKAYRKKSTAASNLFRDGWLPIGFDQMLPFAEGAYALQGDTTWTDPDFIISRKQAFDGARKLLMAELRAEDYREGCEVPVSLVVTKVVPATAKAASRRAGAATAAEKKASLTAKVQRHVVLLVATTVPSSGGYKIRFRINTKLHGNADRRWIGSTVIPAPMPVNPADLPGADNLVLSDERLLSVVLASSAHPSSFGPVQMTHCVPRAECVTTALRRVSSEDADRVACQHADVLGPKVELVACVEPFVDGGTFDNVPLGLAVVQGESRKPARPPRYIYMDPAQRRRFTQHREQHCADWTEPPDQPSKRRDPTRELKSFVGGFFGAAFNYELQAVLQHLQWIIGPYSTSDAYESVEPVVPSDRRHLLIPERLPPITGAMLGHFAAWVDDPFRTYDYYAGIYDGLHAAQDWFCADGPCWRPRTLGQMANGLAGELEVDKADGAKALFDLFLRLERNRDRSSLPPPDGARDPAGRNRSGPLSTIFFALTRPKRCQGSSDVLCMADCSFSTFVGALKDHQYRPASAYGYQILSRGDDWWTPLALGVSDRLENLEDGLTEPSLWLSRTRRASSLASGYYYWSSQDTRVVPSSIARQWWLHFFLPYLVFGPTNERRVDVGLVQAGPCQGKVCLVADLSLRGGAMNDKSFGAFRSGSQWAADGHAALRFRNLHWGISSLQLSVGRSIPPLDDFPNDYSVEVDAGLLFDRFRLGVGTNNSSVYFVLGLNDLTGWATTLF